MEVNLFLLLGVILIALAVQFIVEAFKVLILSLCKFYSKDGKRINSFLAPILSLSWAIVLCILSGSDLFLAFGYPLSILYIGEIATGIIASLGANKVYDLIMSFNDYRDKLAVTKSAEVFIE